MSRGNRRPPARELPGHPEDPMYKSIYVPVDNSDHSNRAVACSVALGKAFSAKLVGCHVYAAKLHDYRFRQMEYTLPEEYIDEVELERQRKIHDSLITMGLKLISDSYLDGMSRHCSESSLEFEPRMMDGKHHAEILKDLDGSPHDLVVIGALGIGRARDSVIGSVCERVARQADRDVWVVKHVPEPGEAERDTILVGIDGSPAVVRRVHDRHRPGPQVRQEGRDDRRLRSLSALLRLQRHRQRPHRAGGEGLPIRGAESAPRGDHRHRARADLSVSSRGGRADGARRGRRDQENAPRRQALPEDHRLRAQDESVPDRAGPDWRPQPEGGERRWGATWRTFSAAHRAMSSSPRASKYPSSTCAPRRPSDGRPKPRRG